MIGSLTDEEIESFLQRQVIGRLACNDNEKVYIVPVTYAFDGNYIYGHARLGEKIAIMRKNPEVCFEVDKIENMHNWQSVILWGIYEELKDEQAKDVLQILMNRTYGHEQTHWFDIGLYGITYRIKVLKKTGRFEQKEFLKTSI